MRMRFVDFLNLILVCIILCSITNFIYSVVFIFSFSLGFTINKWFDSGIGFLELLVYPLHGFTLFTAKKLDNKFNWFFKRFMMSLYSILLLVILVSAFIGVAY